MEELNVKLQGELQVFWHDTLRSALQRELQRELKMAHEELLHKLGAMKHSAGEPVAVLSSQPKAPHNPVIAHSPVLEPLDDFMEEPIGDDEHEWTHRPMRCFLEGQEDPDHTAEYAKLQQSPSKARNKKEKRTLHKSRSFHVSTRRHSGHEEEDSRPMPPSPPHKEDQIGLIKKTVRRLSGQLTKKGTKTQEQQLGGVRDDNAVQSWCIPVDQVEEVSVAQRSGQTAHLPSLPNAPQNDEDVNSLTSRLRGAAMADKRGSDSQMGLLESNEEVAVPAWKRGTKPLTNANNGDTAAGGPPPPASHPVRLTAQIDEDDVSSEEITHVAHPPADDVVKVHSSMKAKFGISDSHLGDSWALSYSQREIGEEKKWWAQIQDNARRLVHSSWFDTTAVSLIIVNAITIGWETDHCTRHLLATPPTSFRVIELTFCTIFTAEIIIRLTAHGSYFFKVSDWRWNLFDCFVVGFQLIEEFMSGLTIGVPMNLSVLRVMRALRLVRIIRLIRILRLIGELRTIITSLAGSMKSLLWTVLVLFLLIYIVAVYFTTMVLDHRLTDETADPSLEVYYGSLGRSILSLYESISGGVDWDDLAAPLIAEIHVVMGILFSLYIAFALLAMMNVVTGVFVESALLSAKEDKDIYMVNHVKDLFLNADRKHIGIITWEEFEEMAHAAEMQDYFKAIDVDLSEAKGLFDLLDMTGCGQLKQEDFLSGCLRLRGPAKALDLALLMKETRVLRKQVGTLQRLVTWKLNLPKHITQAPHADTSTDLHVSSAPPRAPSINSLPVS